LVAVQVLEDGRGAPGLYFWGCGEFDASGFKLFVGLLDVIALEGDAGEGADAALMAVRVEEYKAGLGAGDAEFDPALLVAEGLVGEDDESQFLGVEVESCVLIANGNRCEFDGFDHGGRIREKGLWCNVVFAAMGLNNTVRKWVSIGIFALVSLSGHVSRAQHVEIGVEGGIRATDDFNGNLSSESKRYIVGPTVDIRLPKRFSVEVDALYQRFGFNSYWNRGHDGATVWERTNSWEFPVSLKYHLPIRLMHPFVGIGYAPRIVNGKDVSSGEYSYDYQFSNVRSATNYPMTQGAVVSGDRRCAIRIGRRNMRAATGTGAPAVQRKMKCRFCWGFGGAKGCYVVSCPCLNA